MLRLLSLLSLCLLTINAIPHEKSCNGFGYNWAAEIRCLRNLLSQCQENNPQHREVRMASESVVQGDAHLHASYRHHPTFSMSSNKDVDRKIMERERQQYERRQREQRERQQQQQPQQQQQQQSLPQSHQLPQQHPIQQPQQIHQPQPNQQPHQQSVPQQYYQQLQHQQQTSATGCDASVHANMTSHFERLLNQLRDRMENDMNRKIAELQNKFESEIRRAETRAEKFQSGNDRKIEAEMKKMQKNLELKTRRVHRFNNSEYIYFEDRESWYGAEEACLQWGGHLASVADYQENTFLATLIPHETAWIGLNDVQLENAFVNTDLKQTKYRNWQPGQPDNAEHNENCIEMDGSGRWADIQCIMRRQFLCKR